MAEKLLVNVRGNTEGCLWGLKQYFDGKWASFFESDFPQVYVTDLLDEMERLFHLADQSPEEASQLRGTVRKHYSLSSSARAPGEPGKLALTW